MANNKISDFDTIYQNKQTDCFVYCDTPNVTNGDSSTSERHKFFRRILNYFKRPTVRIRQNKKKTYNIKKRSVSTSKSEEKISVYTSLSSIVDNVIKPNAKVVDKLEQKMVDAITSTIQINNVTHENLLGAIEHLVHDASYRHAAVENIISDRNCGPLCIGSRTQNVIVNGEFNLETSSAFAEACEKRRHTDFILEKIAKVSDALTQKARFASAKEQASILASVLMTPAKYEEIMKKQTFENTKSSSSIYTEEESIIIVKPIVTEKSTPVVEQKSSVIMEEIPTIAVEKKPCVVEKKSCVVKKKPCVVEKKSNAASVASKTVMQAETHILKSLPSYFTPNSQDFSVSLQLDKSPSALENEEKSEDLRKTGPTVSVTFPEKDLRDTLALVANKKIEEEKELLKKISLQRMLDKVFTDKIVDENYKLNVIINCIPKLKKKKTKSLDQIVSRQKIVKRIEDSSNKSSNMKKEELAERTKKPTSEELVPYKKPKYQAKYHIDTEEKEKKPQLKKVPKDSDEILKNTRLVNLPEVIKNSKVFEYCEKPTKIYQDYRTIKYLKPIKYYKDLSSICFRRPKYCVWITPCLTSEDIVKGAFPQDSCVFKYHTNCHSLIDSSSRCYNINCTKHCVFKNSLCTNTYYKNDAKYCYPHLNNIDNVQMRYYHCNDIQY